MIKLCLILSLLIAYSIGSKILTLKLLNFNGEEGNFKDYNSEENFISTQLKSTLISHLRQQDFTEVPITNLYRQQYYVELLIGTPPQKFLLEVDTGSSDLWIQSIDCKTKGCLKHSRYNYTASSTFSNTGRSFSIHYLGGDIAGKIVTDNLNLGGLQLNDFTFGMASSSSTLFEQVKFDGVLGLAFQSVSQIKSPTFADVLYEQGIIEQNSFSIYLSNNQNTNDSELIFGGINPKYADSDFKFYPIYWNYQYVLQGSYITFNNTAIKVNTVIIDSGTSTISGDENVLGPIAQYFPSTIDCFNISGYPSIFINFNGDDYELLPEDYIYSYTYQGNTFCRLGIKYYALKNPGQIILGDTFMRKYYTYFDKTNNRIGFAKAKRFNSSQK